MDSSDVVLIVAGEGGHFAQAKRFVSLPSEKGYSVNYTVVTDSEACIFDCHMEKEVSISKYTKRKGLVNLLKSFFILFCVFVRAFFVILRVRPDVVVSFGPILSIPYLIWGKLFGSKVVHVETWSRFYSKSTTGMIAYYIADDFIIQNESLSSLYANAIYGGRL